MQYTVLLTHLQLLVDVPCVLLIAILNRNYIKKQTLPKLDQADSLL